MTQLHTISIWFLLILLIAGISGMNASELELVVQCKLEMAAIANQRHHAAMASRLVMAALKLLQGADVFKQKQEQIPVRM